MNADRDLLIFAAKAAGIEINWFKWERQTNQWNPLTDDGDALRLAAKLRLDIGRPFAEAQFVCVWVDHLNDWIEEPEDKDPCAAHRRAITRAAAEIGKGMQ